MKVHLKTDVRPKADRKREVFAIHVDVMPFRGGAARITLHKYQRSHMRAGRLSYCWKQTEIDVPGGSPRSAAVMAKWAEGIMLAVYIARYLDKTKPEKVTKAEINRIGSGWDKMSPSRRAVMVYG
ncbi:hypothetical protein LCGC14_0399520 [marine sediment metagenome]|uniref:Uncharacterized protein n=1 Tax=marine sediment metagenome TaxID=412755 RepID=A0A0F9SX66_9ZZZZ